jgi:hypothetical protein
VSPVLLYFHTIKTLISCRIFSLLMTVDCTLSFICNRNYIKYNLLPICYFIEAAVYVLGIGVINIVILFTFLLMLEVFLKFGDMFILVRVTKICNDEIK